MKKMLCLVFHAVTLAHHLFVGNYTTALDFSQTSDPKLLKLYHYRFRFLTSWTFTFQTVYFILAFIQDVLQKRRSFEKLEHNLDVFKGYLFTTLIFPYTLYVTAMFWTFFAVNREWVLPVAIDSIIPNWFNHSVHTNIMGALILEVLLVNNQFVPKFKWALTGLTVHALVYDAILIFTYLQSGCWLYGMFYVFSWSERILFLVVNYMITVLFMNVGIHVQGVQNKSNKAHSLKAH